MKISTGFVFRPSSAACSMHFLEQKALGYTQYVHRNKKIMPVLISHCTSVPALMAAAVCRRLTGNVQPFPKTTVVWEECGHVRGICFLRLCSLSFFSFNMKSDESQLPPLQHPFIAFRLTLRWGGKRNLTELSSKVSAAHPSLSSH